MQKERSHFRWVLISLAFLAIIITYLDRTALSYAIGPIEKTFNLKNLNFGIIAAAFGFGYMIMSVCGGILVDKYGPRRIWSGFAIAWSVVCALFGLASGLFSLFILRLGLGLAEGPSFPSFERAVADWLPVNERARALAWGLAAVPFASVIGSPIISHLIQVFGWRWMFFVLGLAGVIWGIIWYVIFRDHPRDSKYVALTELNYIENKHIDSTVTHQKTSWKFLLSNRVLLVNNFAFFSFGYLVFFAVNWLPGYLEQTYLIDVEATGWFLIIPWLTAAIFMLIGGTLSDWLWQKTKNIRIARSYIICFCQLLSALAFLPAVLGHSLILAIISLSLGLGFGMMPNSAFYAINSDITHDKAATSLGIMICVSSAAAILSPFLTGWLSELTGNFIAAISLLIGLLFCSAIAIFIFQHPNRVQDL